jgi:hypothetical protein
MSGHYHPLLRDGQANKVLACFDSTESSDVPRPLGRGVRAQAPKARGFTTMNERAGAPLDSAARSFMLCSSGHGGPSRPAKYCRVVQRADGYGYGQRSHSPVA